MKLFLLCFLNFLSFVVFTQNAYQIEGVIANEENKGLDLIMVNLYLLKDSTLVKTEFTDADGSFVLSNLIEGNYFIQIKHIGYKPLVKELILSASMNLGTLNLLADEAILNEVTVIDKVPFVVRKIDRTVITPDALISNAGSNALEVLERAPGLSVDANGAIIFKGRSGVAVYINDKPSYLSGTELENYLRSLPAGAIKNIEIIENPPAKYEASGNAGIININLKRSTVKGLYGNTSLSYRKSRYHNSNNSLNLYYNKNKLSITSNLYGGFWENFQDLNINRYYLNAGNEVESGFAQNSFNNRSGYYLNGRIGLDYYLNEKSTIGLAYKRSTSPGVRDTDNTALLRDANGVLFQKVLADNLSKTTFENNLINLYFSHAIDSNGSKISIDADVVQYLSGNDQTFKNFQYDANDVLVYQDQINGQIPSTINIYALKTDYTKPIAAHSRFDAGLKTAFTETDNEAIYTRTMEGVTKADNDLSNRFLYDEWIHSAYLNYNQSWGVFSLQLGLRGEATKLTGKQLGNIDKPATSFTRTYASLFPTVYASTQLDSIGKHRLNFSYGRRIDRPYFEDLNPFISPLDKFTFYTGNPNLLPTFAHNLSLTYSFNNMVNTSLSYAKTIDGISETLEIQDEIYYSRPGNIASSQFLTLSVDGNFEITKWVSFNAYTEASYVNYKSQLYTEQLNASGINVYVSATSTFRIGEIWKMDVSGRYMNDRVYSQLLLKGYAVMHLGVQREILKGKGSLKLGISDVFYSQIGSGIINNLKNTNADWNSKYDSRSARITFSYKFGKSTFKKEKYNSSGSDTEQNRVRG